MKNFWQKLKKPFGATQGRPILALAPMAGITDAAFRYLCGQYGADIVYSEMVSAAALCFDSQKTLELMKSWKKNGGAKFVVQIFGNNPEHFAKAVKIIEKKIKPDGIDINFGCPVPKIQRSGAGVKLFQDLELSHRVIEAAIKNTKLPISIKFRAGAGKVSAFDFIKKMSDLDIKAIMIHGRTLAQGFAGSIDYVMIKKIKDNFSGIVLANGGIKNSEDAHTMLAKTGADGLGIGQAACGRPWIFKQLRIKNYELKIKEILEAALKHAELAHKLYGDAGMLEMRKHLCWYAKGLEKASQIRQEFVKVNSLADIKRAINNYLRGLKID